MSQWLPTLCLESCWPCWLSSQWMICTLDMRKMHFTTCLHRKPADVWAQDWDPLIYITVLWHTAGLNFQKVLKLFFIPLFLGLRSTQSPIKAPSRSTDPATTNPNTAVNSRLRPYSSIRNTEIAKCHMRSPYLTQHKRTLLCVVLHGAVCILSHSLQ